MSVVEGAKEDMVALSAYSERGKMCGAVILDLRRHVNKAVGQSNFSGPLPITCREIKSSCRYILPRCYLTWRIEVYLKVSSRKAAFHEMHISSMPVVSV